MFIWELYEKNDDDDSDSGDNDDDARFVVKMIVWTPSQFTGEQKQKAMNDGKLLDMYSKGDGGSLGNAIEVMN